MSRLQSGSKAAPPRVSPVLVRASSEHTLRKPLTVALAAAAVLAGVQSPAAAKLEPIKIYCPKVVFDYPCDMYWTDDPTP